MAIHFKRGRYFVYLFYVEIPEGHPMRPGGGNMMGALYRIEGDPPKQWRFDYRFRYYVDKKIFHSKDERSWWKSAFTAASEEEAETKTREAISQIAAIACGSAPDFLPIHADGGSNEAWDKLQGACKNWFHFEPQELGISA